MITSSPWQMRFAGAHLVHVVNVDPGFDAGHTVWFDLLTDRGMSAGERDEALFMLLGLDGARADAFRALLTRQAPPTYRDALAIPSERD